MKTLIAILALTTSITGVNAMMAPHPEHVLLSAGYSLAEEQVFRFWALDNLSAVDPGISDGTDASDVQRQIFEGLFTQDNQGNLKNALALETIVSEDKKTYTFKLRDHAKWSDGKPVTAHDFVYAWRRVVDPETASPYSYYIEMMQVKNASDVVGGFQPKENLGVKAVDDFTLQVELEQPLPYFPKMLVLSTTFPVPQWTIEEHGENWVRPENIVVNGAFTMTENKLGEQYVVERNPSYWDNDNTILDRIEFVIINNENQAYLRFLAGELDHTAVPTGQYPLVKKEYPEFIIDQPRLCTYYVIMNQGENGPEIFKDVRVRKALSLAVDRDILVDRVLQGGQRPAYSFTHDKTAGFTKPQLAHEQWSQEKRDEEARKLLLDAGYGPDNPLSFEYSYNTAEGHKKIAIFLQQQWKTKLGVDITLTNMEWKTFGEKRRIGDYEIARDGWCGDYNEASTFVDLYHTDSVQNSSKYSNTQVDNLLELSKTQDDPAPLYTAIEGFVADDAGVIPLYYYNSTLLQNPNVKGWPRENVQQFWYGKNFYIVEPDQN